MNMNIESPMLDRVNPISNFVLSTNVPIELNILFGFSGLLKIVFRHFTDLTKDQ